MERQIAREGVREIHDPVAFFAPISPIEIKRVRDNSVLLAKMPRKLMLRQRLAVFPLGPRASFQGAQEFG